MTLHRNLPSFFIGLLWFALFFSAAARGQDAPFPVSGLLHIDGKPSAMQFSCTANGENVITCKLIELDVWEPRSAAQEESLPARPNCIFAAHPFEQTFRRKRPDGGSEIEWATDSPPAGKCRVVRRARFIGTKVPGGVEWEYAVELKTLEKSAADGPLRCREIKEVEARYTGQGAQEVEATCSTVRFHAFCYSPDFPCLSGGPPVVSH